MFLSLRFISKILLFSPREVKHKNDFRSLQSLRVRRETKWTRSPSTMQASQQRQEQSSSSKSQKRRNKTGNRGYELDRATVSLGPASVVASPL